MRPRGGAEEPAPPKDFIEDLLEESKLVGRYRRWKGLATPDELWQAISDVEALPPPRRLGDPAVVRLLKVLGGSGRDISFSTLARLKGGWDPCQPSRADRTNTIGLIIVSVVLVFMTGAVTNMYNKGVSLLAELEELAPIETQQTYSRYLRNLMQARRQMNDAIGLITGVTPVSADMQADPQAAGNLPTTLSNSAQFDLARNVYYETEAELSALSGKVSSLQQRANIFVLDEARFAWPGERPARCSLARLGHLAWRAFDWDAGRSQFLIAYCDSSTSFESLYQSSTYLATDEASCFDPSIGNSSATMQEVSRDGPPPSLAYAEGLTRLANELICRRVIDFTPAGFPSISTLSNSVKDALTPFGLLFLPALYGAIGAILSLMRAVIDPLMPTPKAPAIFHRVTFGAAAGVVLVWFVTPDSLVSTQIADIGLSLFGLTFLVGFSLDFFLSILDRFVFVSTASFSRMGERPPGDAPASRPSQNGPTTG